MRFHVLCNPLVPSKMEHTADAFNILAMKFSRIMTQNGHTVYFYGSGTNHEVTCTRYYAVTRNRQYKRLEGLIGSYNAGPYLSCHDARPQIERARDDLYTSYRSRASKLIAKNKQDWDFVLHFYCYLDIGPNLINVTPCMMGAQLNDQGKYNIHLDNIIFATQAYCDHVLAQATAIPKNIGIIPPVFDPDEFTYSAVKDNYFLYLARVQQCKGVDVVFNCAQRHPKEQFYICGYLAPQHITKSRLVIDDKTYDLKEYPNVRFLGYADKKVRRDLLSRAKGLIQPSPYFEPFGFNVIEAYLSGTPVITSNDGSFIETVQEGKTGYRCNTWEEYDHAIQNISSLSPSVCLAEGMKYTEKVIYPKYLEYYSRLAQLHLDELKVYQKNLHALTAKRISLRFM